MRWRHDAVVWAAMWQAVQCLQHPQLALVRHRQAMRLLRGSARTVAFHILSQPTYNDPVDTG